MRRCTVLAGASAVWLAWVSTAAAAGAFPWPAGRGDVLLAYGARYSAAGGTRTHSGLDVGAVAGETVRAPCAATVAFAGSVPSGEGATAMAVSLDLPDGRRLTLMPLETVEVSAGDEVEAGEAVGPLAMSGDPSSEATHLHVGLKSGQTYLDPSCLFGQSRPEPEDLPPVLSSLGPGIEKPPLGGDVPPARPPAPGIEAAVPHAEHVEAVPAGKAAAEAPAEPAAAAASPLAQEPGTCDARPLIPSSGAALPVAAVAVMVSAAGWALLRRTAAGAEA